MKRKLIIIALFVLFAFLMIYDRAVANDLLSRRYIYDKGKIEAKVIELYIGNFEDYSTHSGKIRVEKIINYSHNQEAQYEPLRVGDEVAVQFLWGAIRRIVDTAPIGPSAQDYTSAQLTAGDRILAEISGCPIGGQGCLPGELPQGWQVRLYTIIETLTNSLRETTDIKTPLEIATELINGKGVRLVEKIDWSQDEPTYYVIGYKRVKFLFFIPSLMRVEVIVDPKSGHVKRMKEPWWKFLTRKVL